MSVLEIRTYPDPILKNPSQLVEKPDLKVQRLIEDMAETMYFRKGIGLAAPQVGIGSQIITIDVGQGLITLINPQIVRYEGTYLTEEGCLSLPEFTAEIPRAERIVVKGLNKEGLLVTIEASNLLARALQHEIDHIQGILILDKVSQLKRELFLSKLKKTQRER